MQYLASEKFVNQIHINHNKNILVTKEQYFFICGASILYLPMALEAEVFKGSDIYRSFV
jgi:hypothetical protein